MDPFLKGKSAVVTGGTRGIGRAIAQHLLRAGASVAICGRTQDGVDRAVTDLSAFGSVFGEAADVSKWDQAEHLFETAGRRFGGLDILINNAGVGIFRSFAELTPEDWHRVIDLNLSGVFYCSRLAIPLMRTRGGGHIIHISSLAGRNTFPGGSAYNASKFGLNGFSEAMMQDLRYDNIRVSDIMPGSVATGFSARNSDEDWKIAPEDVAQVVLSLLQMPERTLVSRVEMRPSRPPRPGR